AHQGAGEMNIKRMLRHLLLPPWLVRRAFSPAVMRSIEEAVKQSERLHRGELRVAVEAGTEMSWNKLLGDSGRSGP
ncbi:MAG: hypothetical protein ACTS5I_00180, partial [Rhodanobacter sp.]